MSTKSSLAYKEIVEENHIHIYREMLDGCYYIEDNNGKVKLTKKIAELFAKMLEGK